jgi:hypothetical protein
MTMQLREPYKTRPIRFTELWRHDGWRIKVYSAAYHRPSARPELIEAIKTSATRTLPKLEGDDAGYGVGFLCAHDGRGGCFAFVDWWAGENELHHHIFKSPEECPGDLRPVGADGLTACVWDLALMSFERDAWVETVLANPRGPDLDAYLERHLDADL